MSQAIIETEEVLIIETPERVPLQFALASIGNRFLAGALDHLTQAFAIFLLGWIFAAATNSDSIAQVSEALPRWVVAILIVAFFLIIAGYFIFFESFWHGQTPGKRLLKLRVIREDGRPITFWEAAARNLLRIADMMPAPF